MSNNNRPLDILLYGVLVYDLLETLQRDLTAPTVITRLKENVAPDVLAAHMSRADVVIALKYSGMPPANLWTNNAKNIDALASGAELQNIVRQRLRLRRYGTFVG